MSQKSGCWIGAAVPVQMDYVAKEPGGDSQAPNMVKECACAVKDGRAVCHLAEERTAVHIGVAG